MGNGSDHAGERNAQSQTDQRRYCLRNPERCTDAQRQPPRFWPRDRTLTEGYRNRIRCQRERQQKEGNHRWHWDDPGFLRLHFNHIVMALSRDASIGVMLCVPYFISHLLPVRKAAAGSPTHPRI